MWSDATHMLNGGGIGAPALSRSSGDSVSSLRGLKQPTSCSGLTPSMEKLNLAKWVELSVWNARQAKRSALLHEQ
jgi:hypothetical protein